MPAAVGMKRVMRPGHMVGWRGVWWGGPGVVLQVGGLVASLALAGCLAQQADLKRTERTLDRKISNLDQREKALANKIEEAEAMIEQQKREAERLVLEARARLRQEIKFLSEEKFPSIEGRLEATEHHLKRYREFFDDTKHRIETLTQITLRQQAENEKRLSGFEKTQQDNYARFQSDQKILQTSVRRVKEGVREDLGRISGSLEATLESIAKKVDTSLVEQDRAITTSRQQAQALADQASKFESAMQNFKKTMAAFGDQLLQEDAKSSEMSQTMVREIQALGAKVDQDLKAMQEYLTQVTEKVAADLTTMEANLERVTQKVDVDAETTTGHLAEVNKSVGSVAEALKAMGSQVGEQFGAQEHRLTQTIKALEKVTAQVNGLTHRVTQPKDTGGGKPKSPNRNEKGASGSSTTGAASDRAPDSQTAFVDASAPLDSETPERQARERYEKVLATFQQGDLDGARQGFVEFLKRYPTSSRAPNAQYWLGECYYGKEQYQEAIRAYTQVEQQYPSSGKARAALLKKGYAYLALQDRRQAKDILQQVVDSYPDSAEASKATNRLTQLKGRR